MSQPIYRLQALVDDLDTIQRINDSFQVPFPQYRLPPKPIKERLKKAKQALDRAWAKLDEEAEKKAAR